MPTEVSSLSFTRSKLALVCAPGFEILDVETLKTGSVSQDLIAQGASAIVRGAEALPCVIYQVPRLGCAQE